MGIATVTGGAERPEPLPADRVLRVGVIGAGVISAQYFETLANLPDVVVLGVADLDGDRATAAAEEHGTRAFDVEALLAEPDVDTILNLTIPAAHAEVCTAALEAGKNVYVEKPITASTAEGVALVGLADARALRLGSAPDTVLGTGIQTARALIDGGIIGEPVAASASWGSPGHERWHPHPDFYYLPGGGPLLDMGPYYLTALVSMLGPVVKVTAAASRSGRSRTVGSGPRGGEPIRVEVDTHVTAILTHAGGAVSTVTVSFETWGSRQPRIEVHGTEGSLQATDPNRFDGVVELFDADTREWTPVDELAGYVGAGRGVGLADLARSRAAGQPHRASAELGLHVLDVSESILDAAARDVVVTPATTTARPAAVPLTDLRGAR